MASDEDIRKANEKWLEQSLKIAKELGRIEVPLTAEELRYIATRLLGPGLEKRNDELTWKIDYYLKQLTE